jgi:hypothetical protein
VQPKSLPPASQKRSNRAKNRWSLPVAFPDAGYCLVQPKHLSSCRLGAQVYQRVETDSCVHASCSSCFTLPKINPHMSIARPCRLVTGPLATALQRSSDVGRLSASDNTSHRHVTRERPQSPRRRQSASCDDGKWVAAFRIGGRLP